MIVQTVTIRQKLPLFLFIVSAALFSVRASALPEYARQTGFSCKQCHVNVLGGGPLTDTGKRFRSERMAQGRYSPPSPLRHVVRLIAGYFHLMAAIVWFGTIMYVHILLKPAYASKGLPRGELRLGWISMLAILITGTFLTIERVQSWDVFFTTRFGILLSIKIFLFLIMLSSAAVVTIFIGPKLRKQRSFSPLTEDGACTRDGLCRFDGKEGRPAYVAYQGTIYDVTNSRLWRNGSHVTKHAAGADLTDILKTAPHGEDKILAMPRIGKLLPAAESSTRPFHVRLFYFFAYLNLVLVFIITFIVALLRWW
jgi:predicted heme/steroid binding protein/uncharacterized membrane protein